MDGFKLSKESFSKKVDNKFFDMPNYETKEENLLAKQQMERELGLSQKDAKRATEKVRQWRENPALYKNVMVVMPKQSAFLTDALDQKEEEELEKLRDQYEGAKLDKKTASLKKSIEKQKKARKKEAMDVAVKWVAQEKDLEKWKVKHNARINGLKGKKRTTHINGLKGKMQNFVNQDLFVGNLDSDATIMKSFDKVLKMEKDLLRLKEDSEFFNEELDQELKEKFNAKYDGYRKVYDFLKRVVVIMAQGKKRTAADLTDVNKVLGDYALIQGSSVEKIFTARTKALEKGETREQREKNLKKSLDNIDIEVEKQEIRKGRKVKIPYVLESESLKERTKEIHDKWEEQGKETPVFDEQGNPVMIQKLNPKDYSNEDGGQWQPFLDEKGNPVMIQKTVAKKKEEIRQRLKDHSSRLRFGGYTKQEITDKMRDLPEGEEFNEVSAKYQNGQDVEAHISGYSGEAFQPINNALRHGKYGKVKKGFGDGAWSDDVKTMVDDLKNDISHELPEDVCLTRHCDLGGLASMFGMEYDSVKNVEDLIYRIGELPHQGFMIRDKAFMSTTIIKDGVAQGGFRQAQVECRILAPKGTKGLYIEEMSNYAETEQELILDAGTIFRVTKIDATGKWDSTRATKDNNRKVIVYMEAIPKKVSKEQSNPAQDAK